MKYILFVGVLLLTTACARRAAAPVGPTLQLPKAPETTVVTDSVVAVVPPPAPTAPYRMLRLERTPCYGKCPYYTVDVYSNGLVLYDGKRHTRLQGLHETRLDDDVLLIIRDAIAEADFYNLATRYPAAGLKDLPGTVISVTGANRSAHTVTVIHDAPAALQALIDTIDRTMERATLLEVR